jgi:hypothetical protein
MDPMVGKIVPRTVRAIGAVELVVSPEILALMVDSDPEHSIFAIS